MTFTVTFSNGATVEVYGGLDACDAYLFTSSSDAAAAYLALAEDSDDRKRRLADATRYIERQRWKGTRSGAGGTTLAFPRTDLTEADGETTASDGYQLARVAQAVFELAALIAEDPSALSEADQSSNIKRMKAGSAELELFGPTSVRAGTAATLPTVVQSLLGMWLLGAGLSAVAGGSFGGLATGSRSDSLFECPTLTRRSGGF